MGEVSRDGYHVRSGQGTGDPERDGALQRVLTANRELGLAQVALNTSAAKVIGGSATDAWVLTYLQTLPPEAALTAGDIARATGLTTGAVTGMIDRLERAGQIRRERDPRDRRKVIIVPTEEARRVGQVFQPMVEGIMRLALTYSTEELDTISGYLERSVAIAEETITRLRES